MTNYIISGILTYKNSDRGLRLIDISNNSSTDMTFDEIKRKIESKAILINGVCIEDNELKIENIQNIRKYNVDTPNDIFYTGEKLLKLISPSERFEKRKQFNLVKDWVQKESEPVIGALYGLRRTGKTVLLHQICNYFMHKGYKVAYAEINKDTSTKYLLNQLRDLVDSGYTLIAIDEITYIDSFINWGNILSDTYAQLGVKILISGTQSLMIKMAESTILFDRIEIFNTTYISYKEYNRLFNGCTVLDYIRNGGILTASRIIQRGSFDNYIDTAIVDNISHTLEVATVGQKSWPNIFDSFNLNELKSLIELFLLTCSESILLSSIQKDFKDRNLKSALQLLPYIELNKPDFEILSEYTKYILGIQKITREVDKSTINQLISILSKLDLLIMTKGLHGRSLEEIEFPIFVQPGLQYNQAEKTIEAINNSVKNLSISESEAKQIKDVLYQDIEGRILESVIRLNIIFLNNTLPNHLQARIYSLNVEGAEIDIVLQYKNNTVDLIEVKRSIKKDKNQCRWLCNKEFNKFIEENIGIIQKRYVVYNGDEHKNLDIYGNGLKVDYYNASEFLGRNPIE